MHVIQVSRISKRFGETQAVADVSFVDEPSV
jgi:ABC-type branched-subunit amino acid transport system ATPase component